MAATLTQVEAAPLPGPPEILPGRPDAIVDLQTDEGVRLVGGEWRYADARVEQISFVELGSAEDPLGPGSVPNRTYDVVPHAEGVGFDDSSWRVLRPEETMARLGNGRVSFNWYRIRVTLPSETPVGSTVVFETVVDDYAEVWVNGEMPVVLGATGGRVVGGFNAPNRVVLTRDARPGDSFVIAVFGINGPISASPRNYIWMRTATLEFHATPAPVEAGQIERVATGFEFTEGPLWMDGAGLLFSSPNTNAIYRWSPEDRQVTVFRPKSGYTGFDIGRYHQPGSNGLAFSPDGLLTICQHGNRRVLRVNPHGDAWVLADRFEGRRLNSPNDLVYASDGTLYFTDPPFGLPDESERELRFAGVFRVSPGGEVRLVDGTLAGPNGVALSPDERFLYVGNWDEDAKIVVRYDLESGERVVLHDMTDAAGEDAIDGLEVDPRDGTLYVCGPGGIWVLTPEGEHLRTIELPEAPHNLCWGDEDRRTLYVTAETSIYRLRPDPAGFPDGEDTP